MLLSLSHPSVQAMRLIRSQKETSGGVAQDGSVCVCARKNLMIDVLLKWNSNKHATSFPFPPFFAISC